MDDVDYMMGNGVEFIMGAFIYPARLFVRSIGNIVKLLTELGGKR